MNRVQIAKELVKMARALSAAEDSDEPFSLMLKTADEHLKKASLALLDAADYAKSKKGADSGSRKFAVEMDRKTGAVHDILKRNINVPLH